MCHRPICELGNRAVQDDHRHYQPEGRDKAYFWRDFAVIPDVAPDKSRGRIMLSSRHCDAIMTHQDVFQEKGPGNKDPVCKLEDYHAMLSVALESLIEMQQNPNIGFLLQR
jgi:hypothetical protein